MLSHWSLRFVGALEVVGQPFQDKSPIWHSDVFSARLPVKVLVQLTAESAVPVYDLREKLSFFQASPGSHAWIGHFRKSPNQFKEADGVVILAALEQAKTNPHILPFDPKKLQKKAKVQTFITKTQTTVTIPEEAESEKPEAVEVGATEHTKIQALLLRLGNEMSFETWVAKNDKFKEFEGKLLGNFPGMHHDRREELRFWKKRAPRPKYSVARGSLKCEPSLRIPARTRGGTLPGVSILSPSTRCATRKILRTALTRL